MYSKGLLSLTIQHSCCRDRRRSTQSAAQLRRILLLGDRRSRPFLALTNPRGLATYTYPTSTNLPTSATTPPSANSSSQPEGEPADRVLGTHDHLLAGSLSERQICVHTARRVERTNERTNRRHFLFSPPHSIAFQGLGFHRDERLRRRRRLRRFGKQPRGLAGMRSDSLEVFAKGTIIVGDLG